MLFPDFAHRNLNNPATEYMKNLFEEYNNKEFDTEENIVRSVMPVIGKSYCIVFYSSNNYRKVLKVYLNKDNPILVFCKKGGKKRGGSDNYFSLFICITAKDKTLPLYECFRYDCILLSLAHFCTEGCPTLREREKKTFFSMNA